MKIEEYIKKGVKLKGLGYLRDNKEIKLDDVFFNKAEAQIGTIDQVLEITNSTGGRGGFFRCDAIVGCIIITKKGTIYCIESDGEYIDVFQAEDKGESKKPSSLRESIKQFK